MVTTHLWNTNHCLSPSRDVTTVLYQWFLLLESAMNSVTYRSSTYYLLDRFEPFCPEVEFTGAVVLAPALAWLLTRSLLLGFVSDTPGGSFRFSAKHQSKIQSLISTLIHKTIWKIWHKLYSKNCIIQHLWQKWVDRYRNFLDIKMLSLMCIYCIQQPRGLT